MRLKRQLSLAMFLLLPCHALILAGCSRTTAIDVPGAGDPEGSILFYAEGNPLDGYDLYVTQREVGPGHISAVRVYCTVDRPEYALDYLKRYELKKDVLVIYLADEARSCGKQISGSELGDLSIEIADPASADRPR